jgi:hypothetical protein
MDLNRIVLQQVDKLLNRKSRLIDNRGERSLFQIRAVEWKRDAQMRPIGVFENVVGALGVVDIKTGPLEGPQHLRGLECR